MLVKTRFRLQHSKATKLWWMSKKNSSMRGGEGQNTVTKRGGGRKRIMSGLSNERKGPRHSGRALLRGDASKTKGKSHLVTEDVCRRGKHQCPLLSG